MSCNLHFSPDRDAVQWACRQIVQMASRHRPNRQRLSGIRQSKDFFRNESFERPLSKDRLRRVTDDVSRPADDGSAAPEQDDVSKPRKVTSAQELRALAHPLRLRLLEELVVNDPATDTATASEL